MVALVKFVGSSGFAFLCLGIIIGGLGMYIFKPAIDGLLAKLFKKAA